MRPALAGRGFTLVELLIVLVLIGVMSGVAALAIRRADPGRNLELEAERLLRLLELAEQETSLRGEVLGLEVYAHGYRFLQSNGNGWQLLGGDLFQPRQLAAPFQLSLTMNGQFEILASKTGYQPKPQLVFNPDGDGGDFRIAIADADGARYWVENGDNGLRIVGDDDANHDH